MILFLTALFGGLGGITRFLLDTFVNRHNRLSTPLGTQVINVTACLALGIIAGYTGTHAGTDSLSSVAGVGFMGGYSTFSTASMESARLFVAGRHTSGAMHALVMILASYAAAICGLWLGGLF